jgi:hypothetical protein
MRVLCVFAALLCLANPVSARINSSDLSQWLPELPPFSLVRDGNRARHLDYWMQHIQPGMSVAQVLVMLGQPDWGVDSRGRLRWVINPKSGVLQYSASGREAYKGSGRVIHVHFDGQARVKRIVENGVITAQGRRALLPDPLTRGVWWRP